MLNKNNMATVVTSKKPEKQTNYTQTASIIEKETKSIVSSLAFQKENYLIMLGGLFLIILGFVIMSMDKEAFGFGFLGLTLGPIVVALGFITEFFAILYKIKK